MPAFAGMSGKNAGVHHCPYSLRRRVRRRLYLPLKDSEGVERRVALPFSLPPDWRRAPCDRRARPPALHVRRFLAPSAALPGGDGAPQWAPDPARLPPRLRPRRVQPLTWGSRSSCRRAAVRGLPGARVRSTPAGAALTGTGRPAPAPIGFIGAASPAPPRPGCSTSGSPL